MVIDEMMDRHREYHGLPNGDAGQAWLSDDVVRRTESQEPSSHKVLNPDIQSEAGHHLDQEGTIRVVPGIFEGDLTRSLTVSRRELQKAAECLRESALQGNNTAEDTDLDADQIQVKDFEVP